MILYQENEHLITFIDDASRYTFVYLLKTNYEAFKKFKYYKAEVENIIYNMKLKVLRMDCGSKYMDLEFMQFCDDNDIQRETFVPYSP